MEAKIGIIGEGHEITQAYDELLKKADIIGEDMGKKDKDELTDEDIEKITAAIDEVGSPTTELLEKAKEEAAKPQENQNEVSNVVINPVTGKPMAVEEFDDDDSELQSFEEMMADPNIKPMDIDMAKITISEDDVKSVLSGYSTNVSSFSLEDYDMIIKAADRFRNKEKFSYYNAMPEQIKTMINNVIASDLGLASKMGNFVAEGRNYIASELLRDIITSAATNTAVIDLEKMIKVEKAKASKDMKSDEYWRSTREYFLKTLPAIADKILKTGDKEKAQPLLDATDAYIESYTFIKMMDLYRKGKLRVKRIQIEKFKKTCTEFNLKYQKSQNLITDLSLALTALDRNAPKHYDIDILKEFLCIFVNYTKNMDPNNKVDHVFMYYFIHNITTLDFYNKENPEDVAFHDELLNNIDTFLADITERRKKE